VTFPETLGSMVAVEFDSVSSSTWARRLFPLGAKADFRQEEVKRGARKLGGGLTFFGSSRFRPAVFGY
jgi:hypothetical protein